MYSPIINPEQVKQLYYLREYHKEQGKKATMTGIVKEAIKKYLTDYENEIEKGNCLVLEKKPMRI